MSTLAAIPGQPGMKVDRSILDEVRAILAGYPVKVSAAYATTGHAANGDHSKGLAVDLVPDPARGGTWDDVAALAHKVEPRQNHPIPEFRWVGYNGDLGHGDPAHAGSNAHLHLSFNPPRSSGSGGFPMAAITGIAGLGESAASALGGVLSGALGPAKQLMHSDAQGPAGAAISSAGGIAGEVVDLAQTRAGEWAATKGLRVALIVALVIAAVALIWRGGARLL